MQALSSKILPPGIGFAQPWGKIVTEVASPKWQRRLAAGVGWGKRRDVASTKRQLTRIAPSFLVAPQSEADCRI